MVNKLIITIFLKKEFVKKELFNKHNISYKYQNRNFYYYHIPNFKKIIKSNMKIQKISKLLLENIITLDTNLYKKIKNMKGYKVSNKYKKYKLIKSKYNMYSIQNSKPCELVSQINHNIINPIDNHPENITSKSIIPQFSIHCRSKSVTFVEDCLEQIRLFNISDPPNSINMTPTHYSTGRINSHSLMKFNRHNRNEEIIPFTSEELKENALYDHPVRKHRPYSKFNMPYNLKMDFSFGDPISPKSLPSRNSPSSENTYNYKISDMKNNKITNATNIFIPKHKRSPVLSTNYTFSSNSLENSINFMNEKETLHHTSFIVKSQPIHPLNQLV